MTKILLSIIILIFFVNHSFAKVNSSNLSYWYDGCIKGAIKKNQYEEGVKICECAVNLMNNKLSNSEFEKIFIYERFKADSWMRENIIPACYKGNN